MRLALLTVLIWFGLLGQAAGLMAGDSWVRWVVQRSPTSEVDDEIFANSLNGDYWVIQDEFNRIRAFFRPSPFADLWLAAPGRQPLVPGWYDARSSWPFLEEPNPYAGLRIFGDGTLRGSRGLFVIKELVLSPGGEVRSLSVVFEQAADGGTPALVGELRHNATPGLTTIAPLTRMVRVGENLSFDVFYRDDSDLGTGPIRLTAPVRPAGAQLIEVAEGHARFQWSPVRGAIGNHRIHFVTEQQGQTPDVAFSVVRVVGETSFTYFSPPGEWVGGGRGLVHAATNLNRFSEWSPNGVLILMNRANDSGFWILELNAPVGEHLTTGVYEDARNFHAGYGVSICNLRGPHSCGGSTGRFQIHQLQRGSNFGVSGPILSLWATFEQYCEGGSVPLYGDFRYNADTLPPTNALPVATCRPIVIPCSRDKERLVPLVATFTDADDEALQARWEVNGTTIQTETIPTGATRYGAARTMTSRFGPGISAVKLTVWDSAGNTNYCHTTVQLAPDTVPPTLSCTTNVVAPNARGQNWARVPLQRPAAWDDCSPAPLIHGRRKDRRSLQEPFPIGSTEIVWTARDGDGNTSQCRQMVQVMDTEAPTTGCRRVPLFQVQAGRRGFVQLIARDNSSQRVNVYVTDTASSMVAGPFRDKAIIEIQRAALGPPTVFFDSRRRIQVIRVAGRAAIHAVDASGNQSRPKICQYP